MKCGLTLNGKKQMRETAKISSYTLAHHRNNNNQPKEDNTKCQSPRLNRSSKPLKE